MDDRKDFTFDKNSLRRILKERRSSITDKPEFDAIITARVKELVCGSVMAYVSIGSEISTDRLIKELLMRDDVTLYVPLTVSDTITPVRLISYNGEKADRLGNLPERCYECSYVNDGTKNLPIKLDYCITPLLGFNADGYRIGYGKGCYDKFFSRTDTVKIGLAYENLSVRFTPDCNDIPLDCCVTEKKVIYF